MEDKLVKYRLHGGPFRDPITVEYFGRYETHLTIRVVFVGIDYGPILNVVARI